MKTEVDNTQAENNQQLVISKEIRSYLYTISRWSVFLSILGFIGAGIVVFVGLIMTLKGGGFSALSNAQNPAVANVIFPYVGMLYIFLAVLCLVPSLFLYQFANKTKMALEQNNQELITDGLGKLKSGFLSLGIMSVLSIVLTIVIYVIVIVVTIKS